MRWLAFDLRDALRGLRRDRGYAIAVILTLALSIGATTAVFSIVNGVLLRPLAFREAHRLVGLEEDWRQFAGRYPVVSVNERHFEYWREHAWSFDAMAQYVSHPANLTGAHDAAQITLVRCSSSLFDVLAVQPARGRAFATGDERAGSAPVAIISDTLWRQRLDADPAVVGRSIAIDGTPHIIVGVLPAGFRLPYRGKLTANVDAFAPIRRDEIRVGWVGDHNDQAIGRLRSGVTPEHARAELDVLQAQVSARATDEAHEPVTLTSVVTPLEETIVSGARRGLILLLAAIGAVLAIACSNVANLSLTRAVDRLRDAAIRSALGATRSRLVARAIAEQMVLAIVGGLLGLGVAAGALSAFVRTAPVDIPRVNDIALDGRVIAFAGAVSMLAALLVAIAPAWRLTRGDVQADLRPATTRASTDRRSMRARATLLAVQVALSVMLLTVTALLAASFVRLLRVDKGFEPRGVLAVDVALPASRYDTEPLRRAVFDRLLESVRALPAVETATTASMMLLAGQGQINFVVADGDPRPRAEQPTANFRFVAPGYFRTLGITIVRGRAFTAGERADDRPAPALISESTAGRLFPGRDAIGQRFSRGQTGEQSFEVVGIVANARTASLAGEPPLMVYVPYWWRSWASVSLLVRTAADPLAAAPSVIRAVRDVDPEIAVGNARPLTDVVDASLASRRYQMRLFTAFGLAALMIAAIGVYGVTAYATSRRRREMNIRVALGAEPRQVLALVMRQGAQPIVAGVALGIAGALAVGAFVASQLFEVSPHDPAVLGASALAVTAAGFTASLIAARHGVRLQPAAALRDE
jgi:putative ABC transport system permease protein